MTDEIRYNRIEGKEIRGINFRNLVSIILATATIVSTVLITKNSMEFQMAQIRNDQATFSKIIDLNFKIYDAEIMDLKSQIEELRKKP